MLAITRPLANTRGRTHLLKRYTIVLQEQETIIPDCSLDLLHEGIDDGRVVRVHQGQVDRLERGKAFSLLGDGWRHPLVDVRLAGQVGGGRVERG